MKLSIALSRGHFGALSKPLDATGKPSRALSKPPGGFLELPAPASKPEIQVTRFQTATPDVFQMMVASYPHHTFRVKHDHETGQDERTKAFTAIVLDKAFQGVR